MESCNVLLDFNTPFLVITNEKKVIRKVTTHFWLQLKNFIFSA